MADEGPTASASAVGAIDDAKDAMKSLADKVVGSSKEYLHKAKENVEDPTHKVKDSSEDYLEKAKGNIEDLTQKTKDSSIEYLDQAKEKIEDLSNKASKTAKTYQVKLKEKTQTGEGSSNDQSSVNNESLSFLLNILSWCSTLCTKTSFRVEQSSRNFDVNNVLTNEQISDAAQKLEDSTKALETHGEEAKKYVTESADHAVTELEEYVETKLEPSQPTESVPETSNST